MLFPKQTYFHVSGFMQKYQIWLFVYSEREKRRLCSQHDGPAELSLKLFSIHVSTIENLIAFVKAMGKGCYSKGDS